MLSVIIDWFESGSEEIQQQEFLISYDRTISATGDYDTDYRMLMISMGDTGDQRDRFLETFMGRGFTGILEHYEWRRKFLESLYKQGIDEFTKGCDVDPRDEFNIMVQLLHWTCNLNGFDAKKDVWVCERISELAIEGDDIFVDWNIDKNIYSDEAWRSDSKITYSLSINNFIAAEWDIYLIKTVSDPITFDTKFSIETETGEAKAPDEAYVICDALGIVFPDVLIRPEMVTDPISPDDYPGGDYVVMWFKAGDPVSPRKALNIHTFRSPEEGAEIVDASTNIMWLQRKSKKYKIVLAKLVSTSKHMVAQIALYGKTHMGKQVSFEMEDMELIHTWVCQKQQSRKAWERCEWVRIDHQDDDEVVTEDIFEWNER